MACAVLNILLYYIQDIIFGLFRLTQISVNRGFTEVQNNKFVRMFVPVSGNVYLHCKFVIKTFIITHLKDLQLTYRILGSYKIVMWQR